MLVSTSSFLFQSLFASHVQEYLTVIAHITSPVYNMLSMEIFLVMVINISHQQHLFLASTTATSSFHALVALCSFVLAGGGNGSRQSPRF